MKPFDTRTRWAEQPDSKADVLRQYADEIDGMSPTRRSRSECYSTRPAALRSASAAHRQSSSMASSSSCRRRIT